MQNLIFRLQLEFSEDEVLIGESIRSHWWKTNTKNEIRICD